MDQTRFELTDEKWTELTEMLRRETRPMPGLVKFLRKPSVVEGLRKKAGASSRR